MWSSRMDLSSSSIRPQHQQIDANEMPISRTLQYRKVTKPLLERKRRARINRCLDELKDLMVGALQAEGENVSKLEKADILELTVRYLHKLNSNHMLNPMEDAHRFQAGFTHCAQETSQYLMKAPGVDVLVSRRLMSHLSSYVEQPGDMEDSPSSSCDVPLSVQVPSLQRPYSPPVSPVTPTEPAPEFYREPLKDLRSHQQHYAMSCTPTAQDLSKPLTGLLMPAKGMPVRPEPQRMWRPW